MSTHRSIGNFPNGFPDGVSIRNVPVKQMHSGRIFWVSNATVLGSEQRGVGANQGVGSYIKPYNTIDYAIGRCLANRGDIIMVMENHVEAVSAAAGIDLDVDGVSIVGLGQGDTQAKITFTNTASTLEVNCDNWTISNMWLEATVTGVLQGVDVLDGSDDGRIEGCRFSAETLGTDEFQDALVIVTSDRVQIIGNTFDMDVAGADSAIHYEGVCLGGTVSGNYVTGDYAVACIESITVAQEQLVITDNTLVNGVHANLNTVACISLLTATTGFIQNNNLYTNVAAAATGAIVADACFLGGGNFISTTAESTVIIPEGGGATGIVQSTSKTGVIDDATLTLWDVTGTIDVHAVVVHAETASSAVAIQVSCTTNCTDETLNATLSSAVEAQVLSAIGDTLASVSPGTVFVATEVPGDLTPAWTSPARVTAGVIEYTKGGTAGDLVMDWTIYWSTVSAGATVAVE